MELPRCVDTVIVGNGPSALILSYILHGHVPYYNPSNPHPDRLLHQKLSRRPCLLDADVDELTAHFGASRFSYSTQALPINVLLDTLLRPLADTDPGVHESCVQWRYEANRKRDHIVVGNARQPGGVWADEGKKNGHQRSLSYADMLSLPGYSLPEHTKTVGECYRPTRREVAEYMAEYPKRVKIQDSVYSGVTLDRITRTTDGGFHIGSHNITCRRLVLATGIFTSQLRPRASLRPLQSLSGDNGALLVIGSGFSAADVILSTDRPIIHLYQWNMARPSPLKACHPSAYPEYARIHRQMKTSKAASQGKYEGYPNAEVVDIQMGGTSAARINLRSGGRTFQREISEFACAIGRRGSLAFLDKTLAKEFLDRPADCIARNTLQGKVEVAPNVFAMGSLNGDPLVRFIHGGCISVARQLYQ